MAELRAELSARVDKLRRDLKKAEKLLINTGEVADKSSDKVGRVGSKGMKQLRGATVNATPALQEFSRVIQDAPFGIQGVANNIQQLTANFGNLSKSAGGTKAALSAMLGAISGPAGILLAVSAVTSLLVVFGDKLTRSGDKAEQLQKKLDRLNDAFDTELAINKEFEKIFDLQNKSTTAILEARREILKTQDENLKSLLSQQIELLNLQKLENERVSIYEALANAVAVSVAVFKDAVKDAAKLLSIVVAINPVLKNISDSFQGLGLSSATGKDLKKEADLQNRIKDLELQRLQIQRKLLEVGVTKPKKFKNQFKDLGDIFGITESAQRFLNEGNGLFNAIEIRFDQFGNAIGGALNNAASKVKPQLSRIEQALIEFNENASQIINNSIANTFSNIGRAIGQAFASGANILEAVGSAVLQSFGRFLSDMGELLIQYGTLAIAKGTLDKVIASGGPQAIVAGAAAIAVGVALTAAGSAIQNRASGNTGFDGSVGGQGSRSFSGGSGSFSSSSPSFSGGSVVFEISGQSLIGVLRNTRNSNLRLGGG